MSESAGLPVFALPVRVYYEDTDSGGIVYYANYLKFMERARTEWLRSLGVEQDSLRQHEGLIFAVRAATVEYLRPARFNDILEVTVRPALASRVSVTFVQTVRRAPAVAKSLDQSALLCEGEIKIACLDAGTLRPRRMPELVYKELTR